MINENETTESLGPITISFGKFQGPHIGHHAAAQFGKKYASDNGMEFRVYTSNRHMKKLKTPRPYPETPLSPEQKAKHLPRVLGVDKVHFEESPYSAIEKLLAAGHSHVHIILGSDRMEDTAPGLIEKYGDRVIPVQFGEKRSESSKGLAGASSTKMREHARTNNFEAFRGILPGHVSEEHAREMFNDIRGGLAAAKQKLDEEVSAQTRMKLSRIAKRTAKIRAIKRKTRQRRRKNIKQLKKRAKQNVKGSLRHRYFRGSWQKLGFGTRANIDRNVNKRKSVADSMIRRVLPNVIRGESERLNRLATRRESIEDTLLPLLLEARTGSRKAGSRKTGANSIKDRNKATNRKRKQRSKEKAEENAGNLAGKFAVVRGRSGKYKGRLMVVDSGTYDPSKHEVITKPEDFDLGDGEKILGKKEFINTASSKKLYGMVAGEGTAKLPKVKKSSTANKTAKKSPPKEQLFSKKKKEKEEELPAIDLNFDSQWRMPKSQKEKGFKAADYEWAFTTIAEIMVNGTDPKKLIEDGDITEDQYNQLVNNKNLVQGTLRALRDSGFSGAEKGRYKFIHSGRGLGQKNSDLYRSLGATDSTPKADVFILDTKDPKNSVGISFKSGAAQLGSSKEKETKAMATYAYEKSKGSMDKKCNNMVESLINEGFDQMSKSLKLPGGINVFKRDVGGVATKNPKVKKAVQESINTNKKLEASIAEIFDKCKPFKKALLREVATGEGKNQGQHSSFIKEKYGMKVDAGTATHILAISDDGSNAKLVEMNDDFFDKLEPDVKMYVAAKTTDADTSAGIKDYKETKGLLIDFAGKGDFKNFKKIVEQRVYAGYERNGLKPPSFSDKELKESMKSIAETGNLPNAFKFKLMQPKSALRFGVAGQENDQVDESIVYKFIKNYLSEEAVLAVSSDLDENDGKNRSIYDELAELEESGDLEKVNPEEWLQMCKEYVGDDLMKYLDFMGVELNGFDTNEINFADMFGQQYSSRMNTVYINGRPKYIPVIEQFLNEKRNYRKEYDNYHAKPEQRKNRAGRVKARRLMMKLGKVRKGDGKDVDHKDSNPKNNGKHNLRVRDKSSNRADND